MPKFAVTTESSVGEIDAEYYVFEDGFLTLKDSRHKQVASFNERFVMAVTKVPGRATTIGSVNVHVNPVIDEKAFERLLDETSRRVRSAIESSRA